MCTLLRRFLSPAREGSPELLESLLQLCCQLRPGGASEVLAGLLAGGAYAGLSSQHGSLEARLLEALHACGLGDAGRASLERALGRLEQAPPQPSPEPAAPLVEEAVGERLPGDMVPQVNDPDQVFALIDAVSDGVTDRRSYARVARISVRQADFIARAASSLGIVELHSGGEYSLTEAGAELPAADDPAGREIRHRTVGSHPLLVDLGLERVEELPAIEELRKLLGRRTSLGEGTIRRRAQALRRWVEWWASGGR